MKKSMIALLQEAREAIRKAIYHEDGLDGIEGQEIEEKITKLISKMQKKRI